MDPSFGARLRAQRERQQVTLTAISEETKIKVSMLDALERDDVSQWPEGIFRRAYVRAYARAVGLDPEALVREFLAVHPDPVVTPPETQTELENPQWPAGFRRVVTSAIAAVPSRRRRPDNDRVEPAAPEPYVPPAAATWPLAIDAAEGEPALSEPLPAATADDAGLAPAGDGEGRRDPDLLVAAGLCTRLGQVLDTRDATPILEDAVVALDAVGLIVWSWDPRAAALRPSLGCGYTETMLARIPSLRADADNAIGAAFQSGQASVVSGNGATGAVAVPILAHGGCVGVLAVELRDGDEQRECVRAFVAILAAQLAALVGSPPLAHAVSA